MLLWIGINQCTRILDRALQKEQTAQQVRPDSKPTPTPMLILLARDVRPVAFLPRISLYAKLLNVPTLVLPGKASAELGKAAGIRSVACAIFLSSSSSPSLFGDEGEDKDGTPPMMEILEEERHRQVREWKDIQHDLDSFVQYAISKIPK